MERKENNNLSHNSQHRSRSRSHSGSSLKSKRYKNITTNYKYKNYLNYKNNNNNLNHINKDDIHNTDKNKLNNKEKTSVIKDYYKCKEIEKNVNSNNFNDNNLVNDNNKLNYNNSINNNNTLSKIVIDDNNLDIDEDLLINNEYKDTDKEKYLDNANFDDNDLNEVIINESSVEAWRIKKNKLDKKRELKQIDHSEINYIPLVKNIYRESSELSALSEFEIEEFKKIHGDIHIRGKHPLIRPIMNWYQSNLPNQLIQMLVKVNKFETPFPIQCQAIPAILSGRDVIGIAETGSGKTLAYLLPLIKHIIIQPQLKINEGPIGLIIVPSRELAWQIFQEAYKYCKLFKLEVSCVFGGLASNEQINKIKKGSHIIVCTPGRFIELLAINNCSFLSLQRCSFVVLDEADRLFDMGFEPQIKKILMNIRPDRQIVMFSATFHQQVELNAKRLLSKNNKPLEIIVGVKGKACSSVIQKVEVIKDIDRYSKLLSILNGLDNEYDQLVENQKILLKKNNSNNINSPIVENTSIIKTKDNTVKTNKKSFCFTLNKFEEDVDNKYSPYNEMNYNDEKAYNSIINNKANLDYNIKNSDYIEENKLLPEPKILIFVEKKEEADELFKQLLLEGYPSLVIHSGQEQDERFNFIDDFKQGFKNILIATSVMSRGLDVPDLEYVINFRCPNHFEDYVHRIGRTGRAGRVGTAITFISEKEDYLAEVLIKALELSKQTIPKELIEMMNNYLYKLEKGEVNNFRRRVFEGKGYKFDEEENHKEEFKRKKLKQMYNLAIGENEEDVDNDNKENNNSKLISVNNINKNKNVIKDINEEQKIAIRDISNRIAKVKNIEKNPELKSLIMDKVQNEVKNIMLRTNDLEQASKGALECVDYFFKNYNQRVSAEKRIKNISKVLQNWEEKDNIAKNIESIKFYINDYPEKVRFLLSSKKFIKNCIGENIHNCNIEIKGKFINNNKISKDNINSLHVLISGDSLSHISKAYKDLKAACDKEALLSITNKKYENKY